MTAETWLEQINKIDFLVICKREKINFLKQIADGAGGFATSERVQSQGNPHKMTDAVDKYLDLEREVKALEQKKQNMLDTMRRLPRDEYKVLYLLYVDGYMVKELPSKFQKSHSWVKLKKRVGLELLQNIIDEIEP